MAWLLAMWQMLLDVGSRAFAISEVPALVALHVAMLLGLLLIVLLVTGTRSWSGQRISTSLLGAALLGAVAVVAARLVIDLTAPTVMWLAPATLVAPIALSLQMVDLHRRGARLTARSCESFVATWSTVAAASLILVLTFPRSIPNVAVDLLEVRSISWSLVAVGLIGAASAATRRRWTPVVRFCLVTLTGTGVLVATRSAFDLDPRVPVLAAAVVLVVLTAPTSIIARSAGTVRSAGTAVGRFAVALTEGLRFGIGRAARVPGRCWRGVLNQAAPSDVRHRSVLTRRDAIPAAIMTSVSVLYVAYGAWWAHRVGWQPTGHSATVMARAYDVGTENHPFVGMITSFGKDGGASHPGPMLFDLLAPLVRTLGLQAGALAGGVIVSLTFWWLAVWSAWRAGGRIAALAAWVMSALVLDIAALGAVWESNNVTFTMLAMFGVLLACWATTTGSWRAWWWAVAGGSLCAQAYLPNGLIVLGPVLWAGLAVAGARRDAHVAGDVEEARRARRALQFGGLIALAIWAQPLLDMLTNDGGNVRALARQVLDPAPSVGLQGIPRAIAWICSVPPRWGEITSTFAQAGTAMDFVGGSMVVGSIVAAVLALSWWRTRSSATSMERQLRRLTALVVAGAAINLTAVPQERLRSFQLGWIVVASMCVWFTVILSIALAISRRWTSSASAAWRPAIRTVAFSGCVMVVIACLLTGPRQIEDMKGRPFTIDAMVTPLVTQTMRSADKEHPTLIIGTDTLLNQVAADTILSNLIVAGVDARVEPGPGLHYGRRRVVDEPWSGPMLWVTSGMAPNKPTGHMVARASVPGWSRAEFLRVAAEVDRIVREAPSVTIRPWALDVLPRYLAGWPVEDPCTVSSRIRHGSFDVTSLPPAVLLSLYGDLAIESPRLPQQLQDEASEVIGQEPIEVWKVMGRGEEVRSDNLLRNGTECPPSAPGVGG